MRLLWEGGTPPGLRFAILDRTLKKKMDEQAKSLGLTSVQLRVLGDIRLMEGMDIEEINQRDLENAEQVTHPTMTAILKQLESKGFIKCTTSTIDRRYKKIVSTKKAVDIPRLLAQKDALVLDELCKGLSQEDVDALIRITDVMLKNALDQ